MRGYNYPIWKQSEEEICFLPKMILRNADMLTQIKMMHAHDIKHIFKVKKKPIKIMPNQVTSRVIVCMIVFHK